MAGRGSGVCKWRVARQTHYCASPLRPVAFWVTSGELGLCEHFTLLSCAKTHGSLLAFFQPQRWRHFPLTCTALEVRES